MSWVERVFHAWERRLAARTTDRVVRPFDWGLDWLPADARPPALAPEDTVRRWAAAALADSDRFYAAPPLPAAAFELTGDVLRFPSALETPHPENNTVVARLFEARPPRGAAVVVLPHWNAQPASYVAFCRWLARTGLTALRLSLPYHDDRMPPELTRADYIVSANVVRTAQVCRQAVMDTRRAVAWLAARGYERIGIVGTSLGSCLALLATAHEPRLVAAAFNHVSPYFADVVWEGLSTAHVRRGLEGRITLDSLRRAWLPISPVPYLERVRDRELLFVYARYDLTFPRHLSEALFAELRRRNIRHHAAVLPCGHYTSAVAPFSWWDGFLLVRFLLRSLGEPRAYRYPISSRSAS
ncbi:MAG TPA: dienelactone hydrolase family protein [Vicinamibacterales bacterium]|nr:dienelactone hydrolase family protein [Vicinamibacterales bacterium]